MREALKLRRQVKLLCFLSQRMKESRIRREKESGKKIIARNNRLKMERTILSNLIIREEKVAIQGVAQMLEDEEKRRTRVTFNVIIVRSGATLLVNVTSMIRKSLRRMKQNFLRKKMKMS